MLLLLSFLAFVSLGLPDGLIGVAWPSVRATFGLPLDALGALLVAVTAGYAASSFAGGALQSRVRVGTLLALSCAATGGGLLGYAAAPAWWGMVLLGVVAGLGAGAIDASINAYVAVRHSARTVSLLHASYGVGTAAGPVIMAAVIGSGAGWRRGYLLVGIGQLALAAVFAASRGAWPAASATDGAAPANAPLTRTLSVPGARWGVAAFFLYVGLEAAAGAWLYSLLHDARGASMNVAGLATSLYWTGLTAGRVLLALGLRGRSAEGVVPWCVAVAAAAAAVLALRLAPAANLTAAVVLGMAFGPVFPALMALTPARVGPRHAANAVGFQVAAAAAGQSLVPAFAGTLARAGGLERVPQLLVAAAVLLLVVVLRWRHAGPRAVLTVAPATD